MLEGLIDGQKDAEQLADMAQRRMRSKIPELRLALQGNLREHHRLLLRSLMEHGKFLESQIAALDEEIEKSMVPFEGTVNLWQTIPGINKLTAWSLVAEMGVNMDQFPSAQHLASWAGLCPGNNESAGKRLSGRARHGNPWLKRVACQAAWAASHSKKTYCSAQYRRLVGRRGKKRAIIAVAHTLLVAGYSMLKNSCVYQDLGENYFDRINRHNRQRYHVNRLRQLGFIVKLEAVGQAA
jgi:transposase